MKKLFSGTRLTLFFIILFLIAFLFYPLVYSVRQAFTIKKLVVHDGRQQLVETFSLNNFYFLYGHIERGGGWGRAGLRALGRTAVAAALILPVILIGRPRRFVRRILIVLLCLMPFTIFVEGDTTVAQSLRNSFIIAILGTLGALVLAIPLAWIFVRTRFRGRNTMGVLLLLPMIMPPFVGAVGLRQIISEQGPLNLLFACVRQPALLPLSFMQDQLRWIVDLMAGTVPFALGFPAAADLPAVPAHLAFFLQQALTITNPVRFSEMGMPAVIILEILHLYPIVYLNVASSLAKVDPSLEESARSLGDSGLRLFRRVTLPLIMPGVFAGASIVFIWAFTDLGTPLMFQFDRTVAVQIFKNLNDLDSNRFAYALIMLILVMTVAVFVVIRGTIGEEAYATGGKGAAGVLEKPVGPWRLACIYGFIFLVVALAMVPHISVFLTSIAEPGTWTDRFLPGRFTLRHYSGALSNGLTLPSVKRSVIYSVFSTLLDLGLGVTIAWLLARGKFKGKNILDATVMLPLALPGLVLAFGYMAAYSGLEYSSVVQRLPGGLRNGLINIVDPIKNPTLLLIISYAVRRLPYMVRAAYAGFMQTSVGLEEASASLGAGPATTFRRITLPLVTANLIGGVILCFSFAMLEVSDSLILAQTKEYYPIAKALYQFAAMIESGTYYACALGVWAMVFLGISLMLASSFMGRRLGNLFRM